MPSEPHLRKWEEMGQSSGRWEVSGRENSINKGQETSYSMDYAGKGQRFSSVFLGGESTKLEINKIS